MHRVQHPLGFDLHSKLSPGRVTGFNILTINSVEACLATMAQPPVPAAIEFVGGSALIFGGVLQFWWGTNLDHAVLVLGFGTVGSTLWDHFRTSDGELCNGISGDSTRYEVFKCFVDLTYSTVHLALLLK